MDDFYSNFVDEVKFWSFKSRMFQFFDSVLIQNKKIYVVAPLRCFFFAKNDTSIFGYLYMVQQDTNILRL